MKVVLTGCAMVVAMALPALAGASHSAGGPEKDFVVGGGEIGDPGLENHFAYNAQSGPNGEDADGRAHYVDPGDRKFQGDVKCLRVEGNQASFVIEFTQGTKGQGAFEGALIYAEDNGNPQGGVSPDRQQNSRLTQAQLDAELADGCPEPIVPRRQLNSGNIVVHDG